MVQLIDVWRTDEDGGVLARFAPRGPWEGMHLEVLELARPDSVCLRFIDPYGSTTFNQIQLPVLIAELQELVRSVESDDLRDRLQSLVAFLIASEDVHVYVKFVGD